jgi:hypothetical protein
MKNYIQMTIAPHHCKNLDFRRLKIDERYGMFRAYHSSFLNSDGEFIMPLPACFTASNHSRGIFVNNSRNEFSTPLVVFVSLTLENGPS